MLGYVTIGTNDLDKARAFYASLLALIGGRETMRFDSGFTVYASSPDAPMVAVTRPYDGNAATVGNGMMVALAVGSRAKVDELHAKALALGGKDEGQPGVRGELGGEAFYGAYFRDLDGNKLCAFHLSDH